MVIGITGGIGSGKSVVTSLLRDKFDAAVIDTDTIGHEIMEIGKSAYKKVVEIFGNKVIAEMALLTGRSLEVWFLITGNYYVS